MNAPKLDIKTRAVHHGRDPKQQSGLVNPPVYHGSTVIFPTLDELESKSIANRAIDDMPYGRFGTPTTFALEKVFADLESAYASLAVSSGLAAVTTALLAFLRPGDHLLIADTVYGPTRGFCNGMLSNLGVEVTYYDPLVGARIADLCQANTKVIFLESPGSLTFEVQDIPAIVDVAKSRDIVTMIDNSWATPVFLRPIELGVNVSITAGTKYVVGHADAMLGLIATDEAHFLPVRHCRDSLGQSVGPDDVYLGLRGIRTLNVRVQQHQQQALTMANWLATHPRVMEVFHPALPNCPGHEFWKRDFGGSSGLFSFAVKPRSHNALAAMLDHMSLFSMGYSWGGFESLIVPSTPDSTRSATQWSHPGQIIRVHIGLEDIDDLIEDMDRALKRYGDTA